MKDLPSHTAGKKKFRHPVATRNIMPSLSKQIVEHASSLPEGTPTSVDQVASRVPRLMRICQGIYMQPVETRFGPCAPSVDKGIEALAAMWGETIVPCGGAAAHVLGLTTQVPVRSVYLTSGPNRGLRFGSLEVELRHAPRWQLTAPRRRAGDVIRALAWLGRAEIQEGLETVLPGLSPRISTSLPRRGRPCRIGWRSR